MFGASVAAHAATVLTFEGLQDQEAILDYYDGGFGGNGTGPGPNDGITFSATALALVSETAGGNGVFTNSPSMPTVAIFFGDGPDTMDVPAGFTSQFSFFYASASQIETGTPGEVDIYSGLDATGTLLASLTLPDTPDPYNVWQSVGVSFGGVAESVNFGGSADFIAFDNITLGSAPAVGAPEPGSLALLGAGMLGLGAARQLRRRR